MTICRVHFHFQPITQTYLAVPGISIHHYRNAPTERVLTWTPALVRSDTFSGECEAVPSAAAPGPPFQRCQRLSVAKVSLLPSEIRQESGSPVRLRRHGIDAESSRGGVVMSQCSPYNPPPLFLTLSVCMRYLACPLLLSSHSRHTVITLLWCWWLTHAGLLARVMVTVVRDWI